MDRRQWMTTVLAAANAVYEACPEARTDAEGEPKAWCFPIEPASADYG